MVQRTPEMQAFLDGLANSLGIGTKSRHVLYVGSDHHYNCRCNVCRRWWATMGPEEDGTYGPFTKEEIEGEEVA